MLQLGFLKLLKGTKIRTEKDKHNYKFLPHTPYEIISNEWLSESDIKTLKYCEEALERLYNSGRFLFTLDYLINNKIFNSVINKAVGKSVQ